MEPSGAVAIVTGDPRGWRPAILSQPGVSTLPFTLGAPAG
jgi:hypothetical protein